MSKIQIEFDYAGRTYTVEAGSLTGWDIYQVSNMRENISFETDLRTGDKIFVSWADIGVFRLLSISDGDDDDDDDYSDDDDDDSNP